MRAHALTERRAEDAAASLLLSVDLRTGRVTATGELDRAVAHRLGDALDTLALTGHRTWTLDAAGITFCDAAGLQALATAAELADDRGRTLLLVGLPPFPVRLLRLVGMAHVLERCSV